MSTILTHTQKKREYKKLKETGDYRYIQRNELDKVYVQHKMVNGSFKNLLWRAFFEKVLSKKAFAIANNIQYDGCQYGFASMIYNFFDKKTG